MNQPAFLFPTVAHADWSVNPRKRWIAAAHLKNGTYHVEAALPFIAADVLIETEHLLLGVDFPIGLPLAYANAIGVDSFYAFLESVQRGERESFFEVADSAEKISLNRPFYPKRPGGTNRQQLLDGLGFADKLDLYRWCDRATCKRRAGASMFWTMGANQIGKGMLSGLRDLILPNWEHLVLWPFAGTLDKIANDAQAKLVIAECYPGELYHQLGLFTQRGSKRKQAVRRQEGVHLLRWADANGVVISAELQTQIEQGFGSHPDGEDPFDAVVGVFGMLNVILGHQADKPILPSEILEIEGWVFGQTALPINY
ncbi:MAG: DUF429 domain-containing protein [Candidatus Promineifilaceae bacterium]